MNRTILAGRPDERPKVTSNWALRTFGPPPGLKEMNVVCWGLFVAFLLVPLIVLLWLQLIAGPKSLLKLHPDFIYFYGVGRIVNDYSISRLYDYSLQLDVFNQLNTLKEGSYGPSPYPPYVAAFFSLFARLPFDIAFILWAAISLALYLFGIACVVRELFRGERLKVSLIFCFCLAFYPFIISTLVNGQLSSVAFAAIGLAILCEKRSRPFCCGLALSVLGYKPTLLLLIVPMLLLTKRFRSLTGLIVGGIGWVSLATAIAGIQFWPVYIRFLRSFGAVAGVGQRSTLQSWKYVDVHSSLNSLGGSQSSLGVGILSVFTIVIATSLGILLWKSRSAVRSAQDLAWAATLTWTLLLNIYVPIYDSVLVAIAIILTLSSPEALKGMVPIGRWVPLAILVIALSWITVAVARKYGVQPLTLFLGVLGLGQLYLLQKTCSSPQSQGASKLMPIAES
jgi:hypothetical protein